VSFEPCRLYNPLLAGLECGQGTQELAIGWSDQRPHLACRFPREANAVGLDSVDQLSPKPLRAGDAADEDHE